jgi:hypothetical protein
MEPAVVITLAANAAITAAVGGWLIARLFSFREIDELRRQLHDRDARILHLEDERMRRKDE